MPHHPSNNQMQRRGAGAGDAAPPLICVSKTGF